MRSLLIAALAALLSHPVLADPLPAYRQVSGVAAGDTLSVRAGPSASSGKIGDLPPGAGPVEVTATNESGRWSRIIWHEGNGWVSSRYLSAVAVDMAPDTGAGRATGVPVGLQCIGNEPFWGLKISTPKSALYSDINTSGTQIPIAAAHIANGFKDLPAALRIAAPNVNMLATISRVACSDAISDRTYGYAITLWTERPEGGSLRAGCCFLPLPE